MQSNIIFVHVTQMVILYKDPEGKKIMKDANVAVSQDDTAVTFTANKDGKINTSVIHNRQLESFV